jgi:hypothetical protein
MQEINRSVSDTHPVSAALSCRIPFDRRQLSSSSKTPEQGPSRSLSGTAGAAAGAGGAGDSDDSMLDGADHDAKNVKKGRPFVRQPDM